MEGDNNLPVLFLSGRVDSVRRQIPLVQGLVMGGVHLLCLQYIITDRAGSILLPPNWRLGSLQEWSTLFIPPYQVFAVKEKLLTKRVSTLPNPWYILQNGGGWGGVCNVLTTICAISPQAKTVL